MAPVASDSSAADVAWCERIENEVSVSQLDQAQRNAVWRHIKQRHPERVLFFEDPQVKALLSLGATPAFPPELIRAALQAQPTKVTTP